MPPAGYAMLRHRVTSAGPWCSGQTCQPVTLEIAGSNPVGPAKRLLARQPSAKPLSVLWRRNGHKLVTAMKGRPDRRWARSATRAGLALN
jgi:hypothetical protein